MLKLTPSFVQPSRVANPGEFDSDDIRTLVNALRAARETCEPWDRFAFDRLVDVLETKRGAT